MTTLNEKLEEEQIIYQQHFNDNLLKNESKKKTRKIFLICGIIIIVLENFLNFLVIMGMALGITFTECEEFKDEKREECEKYLSKKGKRLDNALKLIKPFLVITCIILSLCFCYNKKIIIINCICIVIKLSLFIGYLINLQYTQNNFILIPILLLIEISSDICFLVNEKIKFTIKN